jgi:hypothetical protein
MRLGALLALAGLCASGAIAQDGSEGSASRTPETANRFLYTVFSQPDAGSVSYDVQTKDGAIVDDEALGATPRVVSGRLKAFESTEPCKTRFILGNAQVTDSDGKWVLGDFERTIEWGKISKIERITSKVTDSDPVTKQVLKQRHLFGLWVTMRNNWQKLTLTTPSEEERNRAEFAIEFLRQGCSVANDTGF